MIQGVEYTYELAWNTLKDYLQWQGIQGLVGSRDTFREAFNKSLIHDGDTWMAMLLDHNRTAHTYNEDTAKSILQSICDRYITLDATHDAACNPAWLVISWMCEGECVASFNGAQ